MAYTYVIYQGKTIIGVWEKIFLYYYRKKTTNPKPKIRSTRTSNDVIEHLRAFCGPSDIGRQQHRDKD